MVCSVQSGFFVFASEIKKLIKSNRVKDVVIVCKIGIRVQILLKSLRFIQSFSLYLAENCCKLTNCMV